MLEIFFAMMAAGMNAGSDQAAAQEGGAMAAAAAIAAVEPAQGTVQIAPGSVVIGQGTIVEGSAAGAGGAAGFDMSVVPTGLTADPQQPTGKFTTAQEVKPIMAATKGNWVAVREYDGRDLLYITHVWSWRCGLKALAISVNDEGLQNWPLPPCHEKFATPNAILEDDGLPYLRFRLGSVQTIDIQIVYDDLTMDSARFERGQVLIP